MTVIPIPFHITFVIESTLFLFPPGNFETAMVF